MRKAGDACCNDPEVFQTIWKHLKTDGVPDQAANQMTAEMLTHGEDFESSVRSINLPTKTLESVDITNMLLKLWQLRVWRAVNLREKV